MGAVREMVAAAKAEAEAALNARLDALEQRLKAIPGPQKGDPGEPGPQGPGPDMEAVRSIVQAEVCAQVEAIPPAKDGAPGKDGESVHPDTVALMVREAADKVAAALPKPKDGRDGFNLEDIQIELGADGRTLSLKFVRGEDVVQRDIRIPAILYRGVWREGEYEQGDVVTWGGSAWHCNEKTAEKPGQSPHWRLMVKEGRAGKDGVMRATAPDKPVRLK
jgi:integrin beta 3